MPNRITNYKNRECPAFGNTLLGAVLLTNSNKMGKITITKEQFEKAIEDTFKKGESWGVCHSTWFTPTETDTKEKIDIAKTVAFSIVTEQS